MVLWLVLILMLGDPPWEKVRDRIAHYESASGKYKIHVNADRSIDAGTYQINSKHFNGRGKVGVAFDSIFTRHKVGPALHERVVAAIVNDSLNEDLARTLYRMRGLKSWTSSRKFIKTDSQADTKKGR